VDQKYRIAILGLGGVGGYFGGKLAARCAQSDEVEIIFIARGENEKAIRSNGMKLIIPEGEQTVHPFIVTSHTEQLGFVDLVLCCVKSYDLEVSLALLKPCINDQTVILPLLNGVDVGERIRRVYPGARVWEGCVYIISRLVAPGVVKQSGDINRLYLGSEHGNKEALRQVETIFKSAGINAKVSDNISRTIWEKYIFISPLATLTSFLNLPIGEILKNQRHKELLLNLLTELKSVSDAKNIGLPDIIVQTMLDRMIALPHGSTSSMYDDFHKGGKTEVDSLTGHVTELGRELHVPTPNYDRMLAGLKKRLHQ